MDCVPPSAKSVENTAPLKNDQPAALVGLGFGAVVPFSAPGSVSRFALLVVAMASAKTATQARPKTTLTRFSIPCVSLLVSGYPPLDCYSCDLPTLYHKPLSS